MLNLNLFSKSKTTAETKTFKCTLCCKVFNAYYNLRKHIKLTHPKDLNALAPLPKRKYECGTCGKPYNSKTFLHKHESKEHQIEQQATKVIYICPICQFKNLQRTLLIEHFVEAHQISLHCETHKFDTWNDFEKWKKSVEDATCSKYIKRCGMQQNKKYVYYACHRSGYFQTGSKGLRRLKISGSIKINGLCPAQIHVTSNDDGTCLVKFTSTHVGHDDDLKQGSSKKKQRYNKASNCVQETSKSVAKNYNENVAFDRYLEQLLTEIDVIDIENSYGLFEEIDCTKLVSIDSWVTEMQENDDSCVLFYKCQDELLSEWPQFEANDFILCLLNEQQCDWLKQYSSVCVCIDATHGYTEMGFELITMSVIDDARRCLPSAFLITNRVDRDVLNLFFKHIKLKTGALLPKKFVSSLDTLFYNSFYQTMLPDENDVVLEASEQRELFFASWFVEQEWNTNLVSVACNSKKLHVYRQLLDLQKETQISVFEQDLLKLVKNLQKDPDTSEFINYFQDNFISNTKCWAYCYQLYHGLNTNMHLERIHNTIEYIYSHERNQQRMDKLLYVLMSFLRERLFTKISARGKIAKRLSSIRTRHQMSLSQATYFLTQRTDGWQIHSNTSEALDIIRLSRDQCLCKLRCKDCRMCTHKYVCTCVDNCLKWNMCKHVHLLAKCNNESEECYLTNTSYDVFDTQETTEKEEEVLIIDQEALFQSQNLKVELDLEEVENLKVSYDLFDTNNFPHVKKDANCISYVMISNTSEVQDNVQHLED